MAVGTAEGIAAGHTRAKHHHHHHLAVDHRTQILVEALHSPYHRGHWRWGRRSSQYILVAPRMQHLRCSIKAALTPLEAHHHHCCRLFQATEYENTAVESSRFQQLRVQACAHSVLQRVVPASASWGSVQQVSAVYFLQIKHAMGQKGGSTGTNTMQGTQCYQHTPPKYASTLIDWLISVMIGFHIHCSVQYALPLMMNTRSLSDWGGPRSSSMWAPLWACSWWIVAPPTYSTASKHFGSCIAENNNNPLRCQHTQLWVEPNQAPIAV